MSVRTGKGTNLNVQRLAWVGRVESSANDPSVLLMHGVSDGGKKVVEGVRLHVDGFRLGQAGSLELAIGKRVCVSRSLANGSHFGLTAGRVCQVIDKQTLHGIHGRFAVSCGHDRRVLRGTTDGGVEGVADSPARVPEGCGCTLPVVQQFFVGLSPGLIVELLERNVGDAGRRVGSGSPKEADVVLNLSSKGVGRQGLGANDDLAIGRSSHCKREVK